MLCENRGYDVKTYPIKILSAYIYGNMYQEYYNILIINSICQRILLNPYIFHIKKVTKLHRNNNIHMAMDKKLEVDCIYKIVMS